MAQPAAQSTPQDILTMVGSGAEQDEARGSGTEEQDEAQVGLQEINNK